MENNEKEYDVVDIVTFIGSIMATASSIAATGTLLWGLVYFGAYGAIYKLRRTEMARRFAQRVTDEHPRLGYVAPVLLPGPAKEQEITIRQDKPLDVRIVDPYEHESFWNRVTKPLPDENGQVFTAGKRTLSGKSTMINAQDAFLRRSLKRLPRYIHYGQLPKPPSKLSVPIGVESVDGTVLWGDFSTDGNLIHALVAGQTGSGKDALLRLWFSTLTLQNTPEELQFVILDGKIDWLSPALAESAYMAIKPAGGIELRKDNKGKRYNVAQEHMAANLDWIFEEIENRTQEFTQCGVVDLSGYRKRTGRTLPYIFVLASDVGGEFNDDLELLIKMLIMRGRSYGVRLVISMQNPVGESTKWRSQIGLIMSGYQQDPLHDHRIMGISSERLLIRPSQLPNPEESDISKGLFVVRQGNQQHLVRTGHMPEEDWFRYIENILPKKRDYEDIRYSRNNQDLLQNLLALQPVLQQSKRNVTQESRSSVLSKPALTMEQIKKIQELVFRGKSKTEIMVTLGFTNGVIYAQKKDAVEIIINATKRKMQ